MDDRLPPRQHPARVKPDPPNKLIWIRVAPDHSKLFLNRRLAMPEIGPTQKLRDRLGTCHTSSWCCHAGLKKQAPIKNHVLSRHVQHLVTSRPFPERAVPNPTRPKLVSRSDWFVSKCGHLLSAGPVPMPLVAISHSAGRRRSAHHIQPYGEDGLDSGSVFFLVFALRPLPRGVAGAGA